MNSLLKDQGRSIFSYFFIVLLLLTQIFSCNYYQVERVYQGDAASFFNVQTVNKYFVVHQEGREDVAITNINVDSTYLKVEVRELDRMVYYSPERENLRYDKQEEKSILYEVHMYLVEDAPILVPAEGVDVMIPYENIRQIDIIDHDSGKTTASYVFTTLGIVAGVIVIIGVIAILTKSSCPYVYVQDGEGFVFQGETFGGAIMENMARDDYMPLPLLKNTDGTYQVRITNELKERQYTDLAELLVVTHDSDQKVLLDQRGQPQLIHQAVPPVQAMTLSGVDVRQELAAPDQNVMFFDEEAYTKNSVELTFDKPVEANSGKLILKAKNSLWLDYLYGELAQKFGDRYEAWMAERAEIPTEERLEKLMENDVPLSVYVKQHNGWVRVEYFHTVGPLAAREFVIPLDLSATAGEAVEVKVETGFMFWELDYAAMDFSANTAVDLRKAPLLAANGTNGVDWRAALQATDENYMTQLTIGEVTQLEFASPPAPAGKTQTAFLHTRGYYELIREFTGPPQIRELKKFRTPGYFAEFSRAEYLKRYQEILQPAIVDE